MTEKVVFNPSDEKLIIQRTKREPKLNRGACVVRCSAETWQFVYDVAKAKGDIPVKQALDFLIGWVAERTEIID